MKVAVIGTGHVGLVTAATLAKIGHEVVGIDDDQSKIESLHRGRLPFFEPGLQELVEEGIESGRLSFTGDHAEAISRASVAFICVGTPGRPGGEANLASVEKAATSVARSASAGTLVAEKSTVPVQTADRIKTVLGRMSSHQLHVVSNPEFLREGTAVKDTLYPDRILVGADDSLGHDVMRKLYAPFIERGVKYFAADVRTAELAKHACNAFLALKISFANALARICEVSGADVVTIADIMGSDPRIGRQFLDAGLGYGGICLPKDLAAFKSHSFRLGYDFRLLDEIQKINEEALEATFQQVKEALWNLEDKRVVLLGLAYKPGTDDVRESPALRLARKLLEAGAEVTGYDPQATANAAAELPSLVVADDPYAAADGAHCIVLATEWPEFERLDLARLKGIMTHPIIVDGRNLFDPSVAEEAGFTYIPTGRPPVNL
jgi:UDPglucose 6-dehydrogenase